MAFLEDLVPYLNRCLQLLFPPSEIAQTLGTILSFLLSVSVDCLLGEGGVLGCCGNACSPVQSPPGGSRQVEATAAFEMPSVLLALGGCKILASFVSS